MRARLSAYGWQLLAWKPLLRLVLFLPGQEARLLIGLIYVAASLHAACLIAGITFTPIYVFTSRPHLWFIWELS